MEQSMNKNELKEMQNKNNQIQATPGRSIKQNKEIKNQLVLKSLQSSSYSTYFKEKKLSISKADAISSKQLTQKLNLDKSKNIQKNNFDTLANSSNFQRRDQKIEFQELSKYLQTPKKVHKNLKKDDKNIQASESEYASPLQKRPTTSQIQNFIELQTQIPETKRSLLTQQNLQNLTNSTQSKNDQTPKKLGNQKLQKQSMNTLNVVKHQKYQNVLSQKKSDTIKIFKQSSNFNSPNRHQRFSKTKQILSQEVNPEVTTSKKYSLNQGQLNNYKKIFHQEQTRDASQNSQNLQTSQQFQQSNLQQIQTQVFVNEKEDIEEQNSLAQIKNINQMVVQENMQQKIIAQKNMKIAIKLVQKNILSNFTQKFVTEIMQESTDAIYKFEDDAITIADKILKTILKNEILMIANDCIDQKKKENYKQINKQSQKQKSTQLLDFHKEKDQSTLETLLYEQMLKDYITDIDFKQDNSKMYQSNPKDQQINSPRLSLKQINKQMLNNIKNSNPSNLSIDQQSQSQQELSKILCESSLGLDKIRKSIIIQQSEQYLMNETQRNKQNNTIMYRFQEQYNEENMNIQKLFLQEESLKESLHSKPKDKKIFEKRFSLKNGSQQQHSIQQYDPKNTSNYTMMQQSQVTIEKNYNSSEECFYDNADEFNQAKNIQNPNISIGRIRNQNQYGSKNNNNKVARQRSNSSEFQENLSEIQSGHDYKSKERKIIGHIFKPNNVNSNTFQYNLKSDYENDSPRKLTQQTVPFQAKKMEKQVSQVSQIYQYQNTQLSPQKTPKILKEPKFKSFSQYNLSQSNNYSRQQKESENKKYLNQYLQDEQISQESKQVRTSDIYKKMSQISNNQHDIKSKGKTLFQKQQISSTQQKDYKNQHVVQNQYLKTIKIQSTNSMQNQNYYQNQIYKNFINKDNKSIKIIKTQDQEFSDQYDIGNEYNENNEYFDKYKNRTILNQLSSRASLLQNSQLQLQKQIEQQSRKLSTMEMNQLNRMDANPNVDQHLARYFKKQFVKEPMSLQTTPTNKKQFLFHN